MNKTMVIKILESKKIDFKYYEYESSSLDAVSVAASLGLDKTRVFKTLVTISSTNKHYVFMVPSFKELDLKKCAILLGEKSIDMIRQKDLEPLTGYVHGGCSPIGMKKCFLTFIDKSALLFDTIYYSGGRIGLQVETSVADLGKLVNLRIEEITKE